MCTLSGPEPEINEEMLPHQKAFVLMQLFCAKDESRSLTKSDLRKKLESAPAKSALLFARPSDLAVNPDRPMMEWVIQQLVQNKDIEERTRARYTLTDRGQELLLATDQYPSLEFRLRGKQLNALREAIRLACPGAPPMQDSRKEPAPSATVAISPPPALTGGAVLSAFEELRRERFARNGKVPVYELRRLLIARHGTEAGSHAVLDPLLKQLRRQKRLRMIAIGDLSEVTSDQLDDSVPGEGETFFSLEATHEYAHVR